MGTFDQRWQIMLIGGVAPAAVVVGLDSAENELAYLDVLQMDIQDLLRGADRNQYMEYRHGGL